MLVLLKSVDRRVRGCRFYVPPYLGMVYSASFPVTPGARTVCEQTFVLSCCHCSDCIWNMLCTNRKCLGHAQKIQGGRLVHHESPKYYVYLRTYKNMVPLLRSPTNARRVPGEHRRLFAHNYSTHSMSHVS